MGHAFDERAKGFEAAFKQEQDLTFRIRARRNRLLGLWVAGKLGVTPGEAQSAYARTIIEADFKVPGDADVLDQIRSDLTVKGVMIEESELQAQLVRCEAEARAQLLPP